MAVTLTQRVINNARKRGVKVYSHAGWLNVSSVYRKRKTTHPHNPPPSGTLWQHITVTHRKGIRRDMHTLHRIGMERFGSGVSYNFCIDMKTGEVGLGQFLEAKGTHTVNNKGIPRFSYNQNKVAYAFAYIGMPGDKPSARAVEAATNLMAAMIDEGALKRFEYCPHSLVAAKDCPTDAVRRVMPGIFVIAKRRAAISENR